MRILLHLCCANCAIYPVKILRQEHHQLTGLFYNHNIHPYQEFKRRLDAVRDYATRVELPVTIHEEYLVEEFLAQVASHPSRRCDYCYLSRLESTARAAAKGEFDAFSTTLLYSRYQQHEKIREYGQSLAEQYGVSFLYRDFRLGWREGIDASKAMGLYRQQYCGCIYSEKERYYPRSRN
ncbi:MAG: epoxyqueuosine reductase QueH [Desulfuromonadales bacterium]|nr:epoxyqueuosine reductase QueH [Desulfuromonadales bacterium]